MAAPRSSSTTAWALAALLAGVTPGCLVPAEGASCAVAVDCEECLGRSGCGWCAEDGVCRPGSSFGADHGVCRSDRWHYASCGGEPTPPADPCSGRSFCSTCRDEEGCGWCFDGEGACLQGTASGPSMGSCDYWSFNESDGECYVLECYAPSTCGECLAADCYWCAAGGYCHSSSDDYCDSDYEIPYWGDAVCPANDQCHTESGCEDCAALDGCTYCFSYDDIFEEYEVDGCFPVGFCPTSSEYSASDALECPREL